MKKGQAWGFDLVVGTIIFSVGVLSFYIYTTNISGGDGVLQNLQKNGELVADSLMSEGSPVDWSETNVLRIGLLSENRINQSKLNSFMVLANTDYNRTRSLFRINTEYFIFFDADQENGIGMEPSEATNLIKITRVVVYNQSVTTLNVYSWIK